MARLRIFELPAVHLGEAIEQPFVVVLDQIGELSPFNSSEGVEQFGVNAKAWGARGALVTTDTIELADELPPAEPLEFRGEQFTPDPAKVFAADNAGHRFDDPGYLDPRRCSRCGIERVDWVVRRDAPSCAEVRRAKGLE